MISICAWCGGQENHHPLCIYGQLELDGVEIYKLILYPDDKQKRISRDHWKYLYKANRLRNVSCEEVLFIYKRVNIGFASSIKWGVDLAEKRGVNSKCCANKIKRHRGDETHEDERTNQLPVEWRRERVECVLELGDFDSETHQSHSWIELNNERYSWIAFRLS